MKEVGAYEAKTHLPSLLREVEAGETVVITRHGIPVAKIVPAEDDLKARRLKAIESIEAARKGKPQVSLDEILAWRHEGHKY